MTTQLELTDLKIEPLPSGYSFATMPTGSRFVDISGKRFERLLAIAPLKHERSQKLVFWLCKCECGHTKIVYGGDLRSGHTKSCGCLKVEKAGIANLKHGDGSRLNSVKEYRVWSHIKGRCCNPKDRMYHHYGGRGILMCERWRNSYENFLADMGRCPSPYHSIERVNNDGNYEPSNCKWATKHEQCRNRRNNILLTYQGETLCARDWEIRMRFSPGIITRRIARGWSTEAAISTPPLATGRTLERMGYKPSERKERNGGVVSVWRVKE